MPKADDQRISDAMDAYEAQVDAVISVCDGDTRSALKALILANEYLEMELKTLYAQIEHGSQFEHGPASTRRVH